jgi:hypothetical protein
MEVTGLDDIFGRLKKLLLPYSKEMEVVMDTAAHYELQIPHNFTLGGRHYQGCFYCSVFNASHSVFFSLFPQRLFPEMFSTPAPLRKNLKAGNRFDFKTLNGVQEAAVTQLLQDTFALYKNRLCQP